jgi:hypothetical protein
MCLKGLKSCFSTKKAKKKNGEIKGNLEGQENQQNPNSARNQNVPANQQNNENSNATNPLSNRNSVLAQQANFQNFPNNNLHHSDEDLIPKVEPIKDNRIKINTAHESKHIEVEEHEDFSAVNK